MTDKDLIANAALAAGLTISVSEDQQFWVYDHVTSLYNPWNPITNKEDADILKAKLSLTGDTDDSAGRLAVVEAAAAVWRAL